MSNILYDMLMSNIGGAEKQAFVTPEMMTATQDPMAGGAMPPGMDPAAAGALPPGVDPMAAAAGTAPSMIPADPAAMGIQVDPSLTGGAPAGGSPSIPPPAAAGAAPPAGGGLSMDEVVNAMRQVMQEAGVNGGNGGSEGSSKGGKDVTVRLDSIEGALAQVLEHLGLASPDQAVADAITEVAPTGVGLGPGAGAAAPAGQQGEPMPQAPAAMGPMDPAGGAMLGEIGGGGAGMPGAPGMQVSAAYAPTGLLRSSPNNPDGTPKLGGLISSLRGRS
jgi:hypothetical protein